MKILSEVYRFWIDTWRNDRFLFFSEMVGALTAMGAAYMLPLHVPMIYVYATYTISNVAFIYVSYRRKSPWMLIMSIGFLIANLYGLLGA